jgi:hypothetical protein
MALLLHKLSKLSQEDATSTASVVEGAEGQGEDTGVATTTGEDTQTTDASVAATTTTEVTTDSGASDAATTEIVIDVDSDLDTTPEAEALAETEDDLEEVEDGIDTATEVAEALESLVEQMEADHEAGKLNDAALGYANAYGNELVEEVGLPVEQVSNESVTLSVEGFKERIVEIWKMVANMIKTFIEKVATFFKQNFTILGQAKKKAEALKAKLDGLGDSAKAKSETLPGKQFKSMLIDGKFPDVLQILGQTQDLAKTAFTGEGPDLALLQFATAMIEGINASSVDSLKSGLEAVDVGNLKSTNMNFLEGKHGSESKGKDENGREYTEYETKPFFGDYVISYRVYDSEPKTMKGYEIVKVYLDALLASLKSLVSKEGGEKKAIPETVPTADVKTCKNIVAETMALIDTALAYDKKNGEMARTMQELKKAGDSLSSRAGGLKDVPADVSKQLSGVLSLVRNTVSASGKFSRMSMKLCKMSAQESLSYATASVAQYA